LSEGGTIATPLAKTFWTQAYGELVDRFGIHWMINCA
jgi:PhnB protein